MPDQGAVEVGAEKAYGHAVILNRPPPVFQPLLPPAVVSHRNSIMKSAYEIAMGRLEAKEPGLRLTDEQKSRIAAIEAKCRADIAAKELLLQGEIAKATAAGSADEVAKIQRQLADEIRRCEEKRDREKEAVRSESAV